LLRTAFSIAKTEETDMKRITKARRNYLAPETRAVRVAVESAVCAGSDVKTIKTETPNVEVDDWDEIGNEISFD